ncbi:hypothetical protein FBQ97_16400, partial [Acidobacteria bacterium ACD]|nr:hypothetical protein [Acidobacteria bacterium ACD]
LALVALLGLLLTSAQVVLVRRARRRPFLAPPAGASPPDGSTRRPPRRVSVLKPLSGLDDGLEENLASFARLTGVDHEVVLSVESPGDPALAVARRVMARFPGAPFRLVVGEGTPGRLKNGKVDRLIAAARHAGGDVLLVSDSNVRVEPADVARTVALFDDPSVGLVSNLFVAEGAADLGATVEALHLLTFVLPGTALAASAGVPCVVGKSMAVTREALAAAGGLEAFLGVLAEDQAMGLAVRRAGFRVLVSPVVVRNVVERRTLARALDRQVRWGKIRYAFSRATYAAELLVNPLPVAIAACGASAVESPHRLGTFAGLAVLAGFVRLLQTRLLERWTGAALPPGGTAAVLLADLLRVWTHVVPFLSRSVAWHGLLARVGPGTALLPPGRQLPGLDPLAAPGRTPPSMPQGTPVLT